MELPVSSFPKRKPQHHFSVCRIQQKADADSYFLKVNYGKTNQFFCNSCKFLMFFRSFYKTTLYFLLRFRSIYALNWYVGCRWHILISVSFFLLKPVEDDVGI